MFKISGFGRLISVVAALAAPLPAFANCLNVFSQIPVNTLYGGGTYTLSNGTVVSVTPTTFYSVSGQPTFGELRSVSVNCFGERQALQLNNASLVFHVIDGPDIKIANANVCEFGGNSNVGARVAAPADFRDDVDSVDGVILPDPQGLPVRMELSRSGNDRKVIYNAEEDYMKVFVIGGQELMLNSFCFN